jgi:hypothetical protein
MIAGGIDPMNAGATPAKSGHDGRRREGLALLLIISLSVAFVAYGIIMFLSIGDKGPPGWDFGAMEDTPGKSVYSTYSGKPTLGPEEQHVAGRPSRAGTTTEDGR